MILPCQVLDPFLFSYPEYLFMPGEAIKARAKGRRKACLRCGLSHIRGSCSGERAEPSAAGGAAPAPCPAPWPVPTTSQDAGQGGGRGIAQGEDQSRHLWAASAHTNELTTVGCRSDPAASILGVA